MSDGFDIHYTYAHAPTLGRFALSNARVRAIVGPFGSGKSSAAAVEVIRRALAHPPCKDGISRSRWLVVRNTYDQLYSTTVKTFCDWFPPEHFGYLVKDENTYYINRFEGRQIEVKFQALDRPDHVRKLKSLEYTGVWLNEASEIPWAIVDAAEGRLQGRYPRQSDMPEGVTYWQGCWMDTNPPDVDSKFYNVFEELKPEGWEVYHQPSGLRPQAENLPFLAPGAYEKMCIGKSNEWIDVYVHGKYGFVADGKPVYPDYNDSAHIAEGIAPIKGVPILRGWDFGLSPACILTQQTPSGNFLVFDEIVGSDMGADKISDDVLAYCGREYPDYQFRDYGDPAGAQRSQADEKTCFDILRGKGIAIQPGLSQDLELRIGSVKKALNTLANGKPVLRLHPRCRKIRKGFMGGYRFRRLQTSAERYGDVPDKNEYSHPHDALQYVASHVFGGILKGAQSAPFDYRKFYGANR